MIKESPSLTRKTTPEERSFRNKPRRRLSDLGLAVAKLGIGRAFGLTHAEIAEDIGVETASISQHVSFHADAINSITEYVKTLLAEERRDIKSTIREKMQKQIEELGGDALPRMHKVMMESPDDKAVILAGKEFADRILPKTQVTKHEGHTVQEVIHTVPAALLNRLHQRHGAAPAALQPRDDSDIIDVEVRELAGVSR